jgi:YD repeat-containing protein
MNRPGSNADTGRAWQRAVISLLCGLHCIVLDRADENLQQEALLGPVRTVQAETAQFVNQAGHWVEGPRQPPFLRTYDIQGRWTAEISPGIKALSSYNAQGKLTEIRTYNVGKGSLDEKIIYTYDAHGRRVELVCYNAEGAVEGTSRYTYDAQGRLTAVSSSGVLSSRVYKYDDKDNLIEEIVYGPLGRSGYRLVHTYDTQGRRIQTANYDDAHDPGLGIEKVVTTYDAIGNPTEQTTYFTQRADEPTKPIPPPTRLIYTYEWDTHGNWIKQTQTLCTAETGKPVCEPSMVTYRTITYYPETERPQP